MSVTYLGIPFMNYIGPYNYAPVVICTPQANAPATVSILIDWNTYWQTLNTPDSVAVNLNFTGTATTPRVLDRIVSVRIDNQASVSPVSVHFQDTSDVVLCPPFTVKTANVMTNGAECVVVAQNLVAGFIPQTRVTFANVILHPDSAEELQISFPQWRGSPTIQRTGIISPGFGAPSLGDITQSFTGRLSGGGTFTTRLWNTPIVGSLYLTSFQLSFSHSGSGGNFMQYSITGTISGALYSWETFVGNAQGQIIAVNLSSLNTPLRGNDTWNFAIVAPAFATGSYNVMTTYTSTAEAATSYTNLGGSGDRRSFITVTDTLNGIAAAECPRLVDGRFDPNVNGSVLPSGGVAINAGGTFDFAWPAGTLNYFEEIKLTTGVAAPDFGEWVVSFGVGGVFTVGAIFEWNSFVQIVVVAGLLTSGYDTVRLTKNGAGSVWTPGTVIEEAEFKLAAGV